MSRNGKIARLPRFLREELNRRMNENEQGNRLVAWLNARPETRSILRKEFGGRPINAQNLCEWKRGGYREWLVQQEIVQRVRDLAVNATDLTKVAGNLSDQIAVVILARYGVALAQWGKNPDRNIAQSLHALRTLCADVVELRRGDHSAARLKLEQERLEFERSKEGVRVQERFEQWVNQPQVRERLCGKLTVEERQKRLREIFGVDAKERQPKSGLSAEALTLTEKGAKLL